MENDSRRTNKRTRIVLTAVIAAVMLAVALLCACSSEKDNTGKDVSGSAETAGQTAEAAEEETPSATLLMVSDYQAEPGFESPEETLPALIKAAEDDGKVITNVICCGDYTNDEYLYDYQMSPDDSIAEIREIIGDNCPQTAQDDVIFVQGNHDALTGEISESGLHEYDDYLVYVLNTQYDFPWKQGRDTEFRDRVIAASEEMEKCFDELIKNGETRPVFIAGHVPLHFTARTSSRHGSGDNMYSGNVFDAVNEAARDLDIIYLFGHNHSKGWDCYIGGASIYMEPGDIILIPDAEDRTVNTDEYSEEKLNFTYMNAGYTGYYMNCGSEEMAAGEAGQYHAADEALTCTAAEIYGDRIVIARYDREGRHILGAAGEADPYKGGIDDGLIGPEHYSEETAGPVTIKRKSVFKSGTIKDSGADDKKDEEEKDAA